MFIQVGIDEPGMTWLEMFIVYRMAGYPSPAQNPRRAAGIRHALEVHLSRFRAGIREVAKLTMKEEDAKMFRPSRHRHPRLQTLGVSTYLPMVSTHLNITPEARKEVALYIMRSQHGGTREKNAALLHRSDAVPVQRVRLKGRSAWSAKIKPWRGCLFAHEEEQDVRRRKRARPAAEVQEGENVDQVEPLTCRPKAPRVASWSCLDLDLDLCADVPKQASVPTKKRGRQPARDNSSDRPSMMFQCPGCKHGAAAKRLSCQVLNFGTKVRCESCKKLRACRSGCAHVDNYGISVNSTSIIRKD